MREVLQVAIDTYGEYMQKIVAIEECSEVIKEICKMERGKYNKLHMAEEIADLEIMLVQLEMMCGVGDGPIVLRKLEPAQIITSISYLQMCISDSLGENEIGKDEVMLQIYEVYQMLHLLKVKLDISKLVEVYKKRKIDKLAERLEQIK